MHYLYPASGQMPSRDEDVRRVMGGVVFAQLGRDLSLDLDVAGAIRRWGIKFGGLEATRQGGCVPARIWSDGRGLSAIRDRQDLRFDRWTRIGG